MTKIEGSVESVFSKQITAKSGKNYTIYHMRVSGQDVNMGFNRPAYQEGEFVSLDVERNRYGELEVPKKGGSASNSNGSSYSAPSNSTSAPAPGIALSKDMAIIRQNALTNAVNYHANSDAEPEDIIATAYVFAEFSSGKREERIAKEMRENGDD
jgi:hypothetical protein